jgi:hypothetical protein
VHEYQILWSLDGESTHVVNNYSSWHSQSVLVWRRRRLQYLDNGAFGQECWRNLQLRFQAKVLSHDSTVTSRLDGINNILHVFISLLDFNISMKGALYIETLNLKTSCWSALYQLLLKFSWISNPIRECKWV